MVAPALQKILAELQHAVQTFFLDCRAQKDAVASFQLLSKALNRSGSNGHAFLSEFPEKLQMLRFVLEFAKRKAIYKSRCVTVLDAFLRVEGWTEAVLCDAAVLEQLHSLDAKYQAIVLPEEEAEPEVAGASGRSDGAGDQAAPDEGAAEAGGGEPGCTQPPELTPAMTPEDMSNTRKALRAALEKHDTSCLLRESFSRLAALRYEVGHADDAADAFNHLLKALHHFDHLNKRSTGQPRNGEDPLAGVLLFEGWDAEVAQQVLVFLYDFYKAQSKHRKRAKEAARILAKISPTFLRAVRSDAFLWRWLGLVNGQSLRYISFDLAFDVKWAAYHVSWRCVYENKHRGEAVAATKGLEEALKWQERMMQHSEELPHDALESLSKAIWESARHTAMERFPETEKKRGLWGNLKGWLGLMSDDGDHKDKFHSYMAEVEKAGNLSPELALDLTWMIWNLSWYAANTARVAGFTADANDSIVKAERHFQNCFRPAESARWRGVNLGGWFLLEPGPCHDFWKSLPERAQAAVCEWSCMEALGDDRERTLAEHRRNFYTLDDFKEMRANGITHVRLPFGAWCVAGPRKGEPYVGPCLEDLDRALDNLEAARLLVLLDLHGPVGGISRKAPTGRKHDDWVPADFDAAASWEALRTVAERYKGRQCVCAVGVANEPDDEVLEAQMLWDYNEEAVRTIRGAGMKAGEVSVFLPVHTERRWKPDFMQRWQHKYSDYEDCVFDVHLYQCFGFLWEAKSLDAHIKAARERAALLSTMPACNVSEWSLELPAPCMKHLKDEQAREKKSKEFADAQLEGYMAATHGWFFWTWKDSHSYAWSMRDCFERGLLDRQGLIQRTSP